MVWRLWWCRVSVPALFVCWRVCAGRVPSRACAALVGEGARVIDTGAPRPTSALANRAAAKANDAETTGYARCDQGVWRKRCGLCGVLPKPRGVGVSVEGARVQVDDAEHDHPRRRVEVEGEYHLPHKTLLRGLGPKNPDDLDWVAPRPARLQVQGRHAHGERCEDATEV